MEENTTRIVECHVCGNIIVMVKKAGTCPSCKSWHWATDGEIVVSLVVTPQDIKLIRG